MLLDFDENPSMAFLCCLDVPTIIKVNGRSFMIFEELYYVPISSSYYYYVNQKHLGCIKRQGQSKAAVI